MSCQGRAETDLHTSLWWCKRIYIEVLWLLETAPDSSRGEVNVDGGRGRHPLLYLGRLLELRERLLGSVHVRRRTKAVVLVRQQEAALLAHIRELLGKYTRRYGRTMGWAPCTSMTRTVRARVRDTKAAYPVQLLI